MKAIIIGEEYKREMQIAELFFGEGGTLDFEGEVLAVNPTREHFSTLDDNFKSIVEAGLVKEEVLDGVVYFDHGAGRAFFVGHEHIQLEQN